MTDHPFIQRSSFEEIAVDRETFDAIVKFQRSKGTSSVSFNGFSNGSTKMICLYRFVDEDADRKNLFLYTDHKGYEEIIALDTYENNKREAIKVGVKTSGTFNMTIYPVEDMKKFQVDSAIQHIMVCMTGLLSRLSGEEQTEILEMAFDYMKMLDEEYK